jgi:hypothetical protein
MYTNFWVRIESIIFASLKIAFINPNHIASKGLVAGRLKIISNKTELWIYEAFGGGNKGDKEQADPGICDDLS